MEGLKERGLDEHTATGNQNAVELGGGDGRISEVLEDVEGHREVEHLILKRQMMSIPYKVGVPVDGCLQLHAIRPFIPRTPRPEMKHAARSRHLSFELLGDRVGERLRWHRHDRGRIVDEDRNLAPDRVATGVVRIHEESILTMEGAPRSRARQYGQQGLEVRHGSQYIHRELVLPRGPGSAA